MYDERFVSPMRQELTQIGVEEMRTAQEVDAKLKTAQGTTLVVVNSVCGCAARNARPAVATATRRAHHRSRCARMRSSSTCSSGIRSKAAAPTTSRRILLELSISTARKPPPQHKTETAIERVPDVSSAVARDQFTTPGLSSVALAAQATACALISNRSRSVVNYRTGISATDRWHPFSFSFQLRG